MDKSLLVLRGKIVIDLVKALTIEATTTSPLDDEEIVFCGSVPVGPIIIFHHKNNIIVLHDTPTHTGGDPIPTLFTYKTSYKIDGEKVEIDKKDKFIEQCKKENVPMSIFSRIIK